MTPAINEYLKNKGRLISQIEILSNGLTVSVKLSINKTDFDFTKEYQTIDIFTKNFDEDFIEEFDEYLKESLIFDEDDDEE